MTQTIATKNLPANAVDKVQVFDKKSDQAEFSGVDDGERQKTINLDLKEDKKSGAFGSITAGYGTDDRYKGNLSYNRFASKTQVSLIGNINNVNEQGFSTGDYVSFMSAAGWGRGGGNVSLFQGLSNGFVETRAGGMNFNWDPTDKTEFSLSYFINSIENDVASTSARENYADDNESFFTNSVIDQLSETNNHRFNLRIDQELDTTQNIRINGSLDITDGNTVANTFTEVLDNSMSFQNSSDAVYDTNRDRTRVSLNGTYRKNFGSVRKKTLTLSGNYNDSANESLSLLDSENVIFDNASMMNILQLLLQNNINEDNQNDYRVSASFVEPIGLDKFLEIEYTRRSYNNDVLSEFYDIENGENILNLDLSNAYVRDYYYDNYSLALHINKEKSSLTFETALQNSKLKGDIVYDDLLIEQDIFRFLPRISWRYDIQRSMNFRVNYSTSVREPSLSQLQPNADNSDPLAIYIGNPDLIPEYRHYLRFSFFSYDQFNFRNFYAFLTGSYTKNSITNVTSFDENLVKTTTPVNVDFDFNLTSSQEFGTPLGFLDMKANVRNRISYNKSITFINGRESDLDRYNGSIRLRLENRNKKVFDWSLGGSYSYNVSKFTDSESTDLSYSSQSLFADLVFNHKNSFSINTGIDVNLYSEEQFGEEQVVPIWSASISKYFLKDQKGEFKISVFDLLNRNLGISRTQNENYIENQEILSLGRYFMFSFTYALRGGAGKSTKVDIRRH